MSFFYLPLSSLYWSCMGDSRELVHVCLCMCTNLCVCLCARVPNPRWREARQRIEFPAWFNCDRSTYHSPCLPGKGKKKAVTTVLHLSNGYSCRTRSLLGVGAQIRSELRVKPEREWKARTDPIRNTRDPTCIQGCSNAGPRALAHTRDLTDSRRSTCELCFSASFKKEFSSFKIKGWIAHTICGICVASTNPSVHNMHIKGLTGSKQKNINTSIMLKHRLQSIDRCVISV